MSRCNLFARPFTIAFSSKSGAACCTLLAALIAVGCGAASDGTDSQSDDSQSDPRDDDPVGDDEDEPVEAGAEEPAADDDTAEQADADDDSEDTQPEETDLDEPDPDEMDPDETDPDPDDASETDDSALIEGTDDPTPDDSDLPDPDETDPDEPPTPILWQYIRTDTEAYVHNLLGDETRTPIMGPVDERLGVFPWSPDGSLLAQVVNGELFFFALEGEAFAESSYPALEYETVVGWIPGFGALVASADVAPARLAAISLDGTETVLADDLDSVAGLASISPDGTEVIWRALATSDAEDGFVTMHSSIVNGEPSTPEVLTTHTSSPMLDAKWSSDGAWLAYGVAGPADGDGGIYLWQKGTPAPVRVSPEGTSYTPLFEWSKDGSKFAMYVGRESGSGLYSLGVSDAGPTTPTLIAADGDASPAEWNGFGALQYSGPDAGWYVPIGADGTPGAAISFPDYTYGCGVAWLNDSEFFHDGCQGTGLTYGQLSASAITTTQISPTSEMNVALSPDGSCLMEWSEPALRIGAADPTSYAPTSVADNSVVWFPSFTADGAQLVYVALGVSLQYVELDACTPVGEPLQRVASGIVESAMLVTPQVR